MTGSYGKEGWGRGFEQGSNTVKAVLYKSQPSSCRIWRWREDRHGEARLEGALKMVYSLSSQSLVCGVSATPGGLLEMHHLRPYFSLKEPVCILIKSSGDSHAL